METREELREISAVLQVIAAVNTKRENAEYTIVIQRAASSYTSFYEILMRIYILMTYLYFFLKNDADTVRKLSIQSQDYK